MLRLGYEALPIADVVNDSTKSRPASRFISIMPASIHREKHRGVGREERGHQETEAEDRANTEDHADIAQRLDHGDYTGGCAATGETSQPDPHQGHRPRQQDATGDL